MATSRAFLSKLSSSPLLRRSFSSSATRLRPLVAPLDQLLLFKKPAVNNHVVRRSMSTHQTNSSLRDSSPNFSNRPPKETILLDGCDFEHWLVVMDPPPGDPASPDITRDEIIDSYIKTLAQVVGSDQEARMKIYSVSTRHYFAFGALVSEELSYKIKELPHVRWVLPDSYLDVRNKDYGGEPFVNGEAVPYDPKYHEEWVRNNARANERSRRNDRPRNFDRSRNFERRRDNAPPPQQTYQNAPPPQNFNNPPPGGPSHGPPAPPLPQNFNNSPPGGPYHGPPAPPPPQHFNNPPSGGPSHGPPGGAPGPYPGGYPQQGGGYERRPVYQGNRPPPGYGNPNPNLGPNPNLEQGGYQGGGNMGRGGPGAYQGGGGYQGGPNMNQGYQRGGMNDGPGAYQGGGGNYERGGPGAYGPGGGPGAYEGGGGQGAGGYNGYQGRDVPGRDSQ